MMMKLLAYKDTKLNIFTSPFTIEGDKSKEDIIESTRRMCANPSMPKQYFEYELYELGEYDDKIGEFKTHSPEFLVSIADYKHLAASEEVQADVVN